MIAADTRLRFVLLICHLTLVFAFVASCKNAPNDAGPDPTVITPNAVGYPFAYITRPTGAAGFTTTEASVTLSGPGLGDEVAWSNDRGPTGSESVGPYWKAEIPLELGDNLITVTASIDATVGNPDTIVVTRNAELAFEGPVALVPREIVIGDATSVTVRASLIYHDDLDPLSVRVVRLDDSGTIVDNHAATLYDDGDAAHGDEEPSDLVWSGVLTVDATGHGEIKLRVAADTTGPGGSTTAYSEVVTLPVIKPMTPVEADRASQLLGEARAQYDALVDTHGREQGAALTVEWLQSQTDVVEARSLEEGHFVTWRVSISENRAIPFGLGAGPRGTMSNPQIRVPQGLILEPFYDEWRYKDNANAHVRDVVGEDLKLARCPKLDPIHGYINEFASIRQFHSMSDYGLVFINSHGGLHAFRGESEWIHQRRYRCDNYGHGD